MQTGISMAYSDSTHFSKKLSYKILLILNYGLKDIIMQDSNIFWNFAKPKNGIGCFLTHRERAAVDDGRAMKRR
jgi:hypothetical protein